MQVLIDLWLSDLDDARRLWTPEAVRACLLSMVEISGLHAISLPDVRCHEGVINGHVMIAESHIHLELAPECARGWVDVFSCRPVRYGKIILAIDDHLMHGCFGTVNVNVLDRGNLPERGSDEQALHVGMADMDGGRPAG